LFDVMDQTDGITRHESVSNDEIREALKKAHIFAYPSIWPETSCLCLIEAMSAGCACVHSSLAALPETSKCLTDMYPYTEDANIHAQRFAIRLDNAIQMRRIRRDVSGGVKHMMDFYHDVDRLANIWDANLRALTN